MPTLPGRAGTAHAPYARARGIDQLRRRHTRSLIPPTAAALSCLRRKKEADGHGKRHTSRRQSTDFTLLSQSGAPVRLYDRLDDGVVVLYFYPKDETRGCTAEACAFRDSHEVFTDAGAEVIGVSSDSVHKHAAFATRHNLPFTLLSDEEGQVRKDYGVPSVLGIIPGRVTYVIDRQGTVRHVFNSLTNTDKHVNDALDVVRNISAEDPV
ncbi:peroxiredoxin [Streptomyces bullii]|uniref:thioredoxin-dependent peroxiredoxin n=1 Tax=Streptomyces bullii TaxID=349910 RepID=A0ABW0UZQ0_9ACTN